MQRAILERALREIALDLAVMVPLDPNNPVSLDTDRGQWRRLSAIEVAREALIEAGIYSHGEL